MAAQRCFVAVAPDSHFPLQNLPYGIFNTPSNPRKRVGVAIGDSILDLAALAEAGLLTGQLLGGDKGSCFAQGTLNAFMALGPSAWAEARATATRLLSTSEAALRDNAALQQKVLVPQANAQMHLPAEIGDYTDFYLSKEHATSCTRIFRGENTPLQANWSTLPVAYHGRASSVVVSGTPVRRPRGQVLGGQEQETPEYAACKVLDYELEMGALIGVGNELGSAIGTAAAPGHVFGMVLLNDWSARDIQKWEYVPLGPFNGKNFATSISPWVVPLAALEPFKCDAPPQDPPVLPYLQEGASRRTYNIHLEVAIQPQGQAQPSTVATSNYRHLYWTLPQMVAHHTVGGCNLRTGDLLGTGTISREVRGLQVV